MSIDQDTIERRKQQNRDSAKRHRNRVQGKEPPAAPLAGRIRKFFTACPDEELTYQDMAIKFDCSRRQAQDAVKSLRRRRRDVKLALVYEKAISATVVRVAG